MSIRILLFSLILSATSCNSVKTATDKSEEDSLVFIHTVRDSSVIYEEGSINNELVQQLNAIYLYDQKERLLLEDTINKYGDASPEVWRLWRVINENDSINLLQVKAILDKYGWLGEDEVGSKGNQTLFLVIQHADLKTQEKYLPVMKEAVKKGKASPADLAYLIDRIERRNGRPQIYGSQLTGRNGHYVVDTIIDKKNVDARRAAVGLPPLEEFLKSQGY